MFSFVRNPWDRMVSFYFHSNYQHSIKFRHYIRDVVRNKSPFRKSQLSYISDHSGRLKIDFIGRYDMLENDFHIVCKNLGIEQIKLPKLGATDHKNYREYYGSKSRERVYNHFYEEIKEFGFTF